MNAKMQASWRKMVGVALLWAALASLVYVPTAEGGTQTTIVRVLGFFAFAIGLSLFAEGMKLDIVDHLQETA